MYNITMYLIYRYTKSGPSLSRISKPALPVQTDFKDS